MNNQLDIYVWGIEDRYSVRISEGGFGIILAQFTDKQVACNFRDWLVRDVPATVLQRMIETHYAASVPDNLVAWYDLIKQRRNHPAADMDYYAYVNSLPTSTPKGTA